MDKTAKELVNDMVFEKVASVTSSVGKVLGEAKGLAKGLTGDAAKKGLGYMGKGAVAGGVAGAVTGAAADGGKDKSSGTIKGALIGAGMGALGGGLVEKHVGNVASKNYTKGLSHGTLIGAGGATVASNAANLIKNAPQGAKDTLNSFVKKTKAGAEKATGTAKDLAGKVKDKINNI
jgi:hypothetical protein